MSSRTRIRVYLILIAIGLGVVSWLYWDTARKLKGAGYDVTLVEIENVGHSLSEQAIQETLELFRRVNS